MNRAISWLPPMFKELMRRIGNTFIIFAADFGNHCFNGDYFDVQSLFTLGHDTDLS